MALNILSSKDIGSALGKIFLNKDEIELLLSLPCLKHLSRAAEVQLDPFHAVGRNGVC